MSLEAQKSFQQREFVMEWELKQKTLGLPDRQWPPIVLEWATIHWGVTDPPSVERFLEKWDAYMIDHMHMVEVCRGAKDLVSELASAQFPLAIATSSRTMAVERKKQRHQDMFKKIKTIVAGDDHVVKNGKPAPDIYLEAARRINVKPEECIVFEDSMTGVRAAKAAGCFVVAVPDVRCNVEGRQVFENMADVVLVDLTQFKKAIALH